MRLWRLGREIYADSAWTGEGAWRCGGRWNSPRTRVIYASSSLALAAIEFFVNLEPNLAPDDLLAFAGVLPDDLETPRLALDTLPPEWNCSRLESLRSVGDVWVNEASSVALEVPSAAVPGEWNVLVNPIHPDFARFRPQSPSPFHFDPRMYGH